jgi:hypothetical protein
MTFELTRARVEAQIERTSREVAAMRAEAERTRNERIEDARAELEQRERDAAKAAEKLRQRQLWRRRQAPTRPSPPMIASCRKGDPLCAADLG